MKPLSDNAALFGYSGISSIPGHPLGNSALAFSTKQDWVAEIICERIIVGAYPRGGQLKQPDLAAELGASITRVREALLTLEAEGYVRGLRHNGLLLPELVADGAREIYELRLTLERQLTQAALKRLKPVGLGDLQDLERGLVRALDSDDLQSVHAANYCFHFRLYEMADRPQTLQFVRGLWANYPFTAQDVNRARPRHMREEHEHFLDRAGPLDIAGAIEAMVAHIRNGWREIAETDLAMTSLAAGPGEGAFGLSLEHIFYMLHHSAKHVLRIFEIAAASAGKRTSTR